MTPSMALYYRRKADGACVRCGKPRLRGKRLTCRECAAYAAQAAAKWRAERLAKAPAATRGKAAAGTRALYRRRKQAGVCVRCGKPPVAEGRVHCAGHAAENRANINRYRSVH